MHDPIRSAIFPVAGLGTRLLPATKSVPKELLPVYDTPLLQFAIDEALEAGVERLVFITHDSKAAIEHFARPDAALARSLEARGKEHLLEGVGCGPHVEVIFTQQDKQLGLGHAVAAAADAVLPGPVAVLLPDDLILGANCLGEMARAYARGDAGHMVATMVVPRPSVRQYGVLDTAGAPLGRLVRATGIVEKPQPEDAPSALAVVGRYILDPCIFADLAETRPGSGGEIQLTDAIARGIPRVGLAGFRFSGTRFDCGNADGLLDAGNAVRDQRRNPHPAAREVVSLPAE